MTSVNALFSEEQGGVAASPRAVQRGFEVTTRYGDELIVDERAEMPLRYRLTTTLGTTYIVEPLGYVETDASWGRCLATRFLDSRGYWAEGDFRCDQIVSLEPELALEGG